MVPGRSNGKAREQGGIERHGNSLRVKVYAGVDPLTGKRLYLTKSATDEARRSGSSRSSARRSTTSEAPAPGPYSAWRSRSGSRSMSWKRPRATVTSARGWARVWSMPSVCLLRKVVIGAVSRPARRSGTGAAAIRGRWRSRRGRPAGRARVGDRAPPRLPGWGTTTEMAIVIRHQLAMNRLGLDRHSRSARRESLAVCLVAVLTVGVVRRGRWVRTGGSRSGRRGGGPSWR